MSEIEKMYENAGIEKSCNSDLEFCPVAFCDECNLNIYPPFTAEKQITLLQILIFNNKTFSIGRVYPHNIIQINNDKYVGKGETFGEALAEIINKLWADMPAEEKQQVKGILE